ncbi:MAG TPA: hypothetical protein VJV22_14105 [Acidobacteriaceae bacterium]|nr:hypothetical protein [Acidobacteriaceae bacterium]
MKYPGGGAKRTSERLAQAGNKVLVRFTRPVEQGWVHGYVLIVGTRFFLLALVDDNLRFNGFQCFRLQDVRNLQVPAKYAAFVEAALRARGERHPRTPPVVIDTVQELLRTASRVFPLVTIHRENVAPDICHIGRVVDVSDSEVSLLEIGPDANWDEQSCDYRLKEITRVDFGGGYEEALWLVGGLSGSRPKKTQNAAHH